MSSATAIMRHLTMREVLSIFIFISSVFVQAIANGDSERSPEADVQSQNQKKSVSNVQRLVYCCADCSSVSNNSHALIHLSVALKCLNH